MEITFGVLIFCIVAFFVAGFIDSIAGGAGFVTAPSLLLIGMPPHMALGTGKIDGATMGKVIVIMLPLGILFTVLTGGFKLTEGELPKDHFWLRVVLIGVLIGFYEGFFGPGAGTFFLIALHVFLKIGMVQSSGTAKAFNIAANFAAFLTFASVAAVCYEIAIPCAIASMLGNRVGAYYAIKIGGKFVRNILYIVLVILMVSLIYKFFIAG